MKRIIFVMPTFGSGGAEISLLMLLHLLSAREDVQVDLLLFKQEGMFLDQVPEKVRILTPEESLRVAYAPFSFKNCKTLRGALLSVMRPVATTLSRLLTKSYNASGQLRWVKCYRHLIRPMAEHYDYACGYLDSEATYYVVDKIQADKKFGWNHNDYIELAQDAKIDASYYEKLDKIITISDRCTEILSQVFPQHRQKMLQIPNIVIPAYLEQRAGLFIPEEYTAMTGAKLLSVGRLTEQKGFDLAIDAAALLKNSGLDFCWFIIGIGHLQAELEKQIEKHGLQDHVKLLGQRSNPYPYIQNADLFIQPSRFEGKSIVLTEAKLLCKPIIATRYATVSDQITDGTDGLLADLNATDIAETISRLLADPQLCDQLCSNLQQQRQAPSEEIQKNLALFALA